MKASDTWSHNSHALIAEAFAGVVEVGCGVEVCRVGMGIRIWVSGREGIPSMTAAVVAAGWAVVIISMRDGKQDCGPFERHPELIIRTILSTISQISIQFLHWAAWRGLITIQTNYAPKSSPIQAKRVREARETSYLCGFLLATEHPNMNENNFSSLIIFFRSTLNITIVAFPSCRFTWGRK